MYDDVPTEKILEMRQRGMSDAEIRDALERERFGNKQISDGFTQASVKSGVESQNYSDQGYMGYGQQDSGYPPQGQQEPYQQGDYGGEFGVEPGMRESAMSSGGPALPPAPEAPGGQEYYEEPEERASFKSPEMPQVSTEEIEDKISQIAESVIDERWQEVAGVMGNIKVWKARIGDDVLAIKQEILRMGKRFENLERAVLGKVSEYNRSVIDMGSEIKALEKVLEKIMQPLSTNVKELEKLAKRVKTRKK